MSTGRRRRTDRRDRAPRCRSRPRPAAREAVALGGVARDAVEHGAEELALREALGVRRLVEHQLHHDELVNRHPGDARQQALEARVELIAWRALDGEAPGDGLGARQATTGEQQSLGLLEANAVDPERGGRRAPHARRRVADLGDVPDHEQVAA
jgi:hypothetical protein